MQINTIKKTEKVLFLVILFILLINNNIEAQVIKRSESICVYVYNFCKEINWNFETEPETFNILLISENEELISAFTNFSIQKKIKGKEIELTVRASIDFDIEKVHLIYLDNTENYNYFSVFEKIQGNKILLVSDNYTDRRFVMINLYDSEDERLLFELNKANIINQGLEILPDILLYGGTEIEVAELYKESQITLLGMELELRNSKKQIDSIIIKLALLETDIEKKQEELKIQNNLVAEKEHKIALQEVKLEELNKNVLAKEKLYKYQEKQLKIKNDSLINKTKLLSEQEQLFIEQKNKLDTLQSVLDQKYSEITKMDDEIKTKNEVLDSQDITISRQRYFLFLFGIIVFLTGVLIIVLYKGFRSKKLLNHQLTNKTIQISKINKKLQNSNEELQTKNEQLNNANVKISSTLEILQKAQAQLVQSEKMASLGVLTAGIAHEINNPINFVYAGINSLKKDFDDLIPILDEITNLTENTSDEDLKIIKDKIIKFKEENYFSEAYEAIPITIKDIQIGADRVAEIIKGLRNFSRLDKQSWEKENIHKGLDSTLLLLKNAYKNKIEVIKNYHPELPYIQCLPGKINQVFMNIINNAIDSIPAKGIIEIKTYFDKTNIYISIKDNGIGIDSEVKSKVFDPFFTTKEIGKGVGLGLSITYGIINEHNGNIEVLSEVGKGSEFIIKLPIVQSK